MLEFMVKKLGILKDDFLVLCGHTHSEANFQALNNLTVRAGRAEYGYPKIQEFSLDV